MVGHGGMGSVYRAEDLRLPGRLCAIKEIQPDPNASAELRAQEQEQFLREASVLAQLDHPNLPKVSDFFTDGSREFLVMDFVPGRDLQALLSESIDSGRPLEPVTVLGWMRQLLDAVAYLHNQEPPVLHRDIKPANIKLTPDNRIKLVDFGLVKLMAEDDLRTITVVQGRGTALYTPLEQYGGDGSHTDVRSDIYAVGATLYHLLTGQPPALARTRFLNPRVMRPVRELNPDVPEGVSEAVDWALEMHPDNRPADIAAWRDVLFDDGRRPPPRQNEPPAAPISAALAANAGLVIIALVLLIVAIIATLN